MNEPGGFPWVLIHLGWIVLALAIVYGIWRNRSRRLSPGEKETQIRQTRKNFRVDEDSA